MQMEVKADSHYYLITDILGYREKVGVELPGEIIKVLRKKNGLRVRKVEGLG